MFLLQQSTATSSVSTMGGTSAAVLISEDPDSVPPIVVPIHPRLAKSGVGGGRLISNFTSFLGFSGKRLEAGGRSRRRVHGGTHVPLLVCLP